MEFVYNTTFGKIFYQNICEFNENAKSEYLKFLDLKKFITFVAVMTKRNNKDNTISMQEFRKRFAFRLFDTDNNEEIDRLEFRNFVTAFLEMILTCNFENETIQNKIRILKQEASSNMHLVEKALDQYVDEIYNTTFDGYVMTYDEWDRWISSVDGINEINGYFRELITNNFPK